MWVLQSYINQPTFHVLLDSLYYSFKNRSEFVGKNKKEQKITYLSILMNEIRKLICRLSFLKVSLFKRIHSLTYFVIKIYQYMGLHCYRNGERKANNVVFDVLFPYCIRRTSFTDVI